MAREDVVEGENPHRLVKLMDPDTSDPFSQLNLLWNYQDMEERWLAING